MDEASQWQPDERATTEPKKYRINTWSKTVLGIYGVHYVRIQNYKNFDKYLCKSFVNIRL